MKNKKLTRFLVTVLLVVWGAIAYQIVSAVWQSDEENTTRVSDFENSGLKQSSYVYKDDVRDPFRFFVPPKKDTVKKHAVQIKPDLWVPPPYRLTGILLNDRKRTAVLEGQSSSIFFLQEKDTLDGIQILMIKENQVIYNYQKRKGEWGLQ